ncbi:OsmC family protein, partial [Zopfochytrium polystomum]
AAATATATQRRSILNISSVYAAEAVATGKGRDGFVKGSEGFETKMALPKSLGGPGNSATAQNPEILFAAGYASCFLAAVHAVGGRLKIKTSDASVRTKIHIGSIEGTTGFGLAAEIYVKLPGLDQESAQKVLEAAHEMCPYSTATRGNIDVRVALE